MAGAIAGLASGIARHRLAAEGGQAQSAQAGGRSFQSVLEKVGQGRAEGAETQAAAPAQTDGAPQMPQRPEGLSADVMRNLTRVILNEESGPRRRGFVDILSQAEKASFHSDAALRELSRNQDLTQGDLLVMQAMVYKAAQSTEMMSKVVDQVTGGVKTILNTSV